MAQKEQNQKEKSQSFESNADLERRVELPDNFILVLHKLKQPKQSCNLHQPVQFAYPGYSDELIRVVRPTP